jgi:hypothetical protein
MPALNEASHDEFTSRRSSLGLNIFLVLAPDTSGCLHAPATLPLIRTEHKIVWPSEPVPMLLSSYCCCQQYIECEMQNARKTMQFSISRQCVTQLATLSYDTHLWHRDASWVVTHRDKGNDLCTQTTGSNILQSNCTTRVLGPLGIPILVLRWDTPQDKCTLGLPGRSSVSQPKPQDSKTFRIDIVSLMCLHDCRQ